MDFGLEIVSGVLKRLCRPAPSSVMIPDTVGARVGSRSSKFGNREHI